MQEALGSVHTGRGSTNPLMLLASCVNTPIDCSAFHNLHTLCCELLRILCERSLCVKTHFVAHDVGEKCTFQPGNQHNVKRPTQKWVDLADHVLAYLVRHFPTQFSGIFTARRCCVVRWPTPEDANF